MTRLKNLRPPRKSEVDRVMTAPDARSLLAALVEACEDYLTQDRDLGAIGFNTEQARAFLEAATPDAVGLRCADCDNKVRLIHLYPVGNPPPRLHPVHLAIEAEAAPAGGLREALRPYDERIDPERSTGEMSAREWRDAYFALARIALKELEECRAALAAAQPKEPIRHYDGDACGQPDHDRAMEAWQATVEQGLARMAAQPAEGLDPEVLADAFTWFHAHSAGMCSESHRADAADYARLREGGA